MEVYGSWRSWDIRRHETMIAALVILYTITIVSLTIFGFLFYFQEKRQQLLGREVAQLQEDMKLVQENCQTLRQNDDILAKDLEMLLHEFKNAEKKVKRNSWWAKASNSVRSRKTHQASPIPGLLYQSIRGWQEVVQSLYDCSCPINGWWNPWDNGTTLPDFW